MKHRLGSKVGVEKLSFILAQLLRSCLSYYFLIEIELFLAELDFNF